MVEERDNMMEKRRYKRVESSLPIRYRNLKMAAAPAGSLTKDIGEGGVNFKASEFISLACRFVLEITLPTVQRPIKAISKVAWIRKTPSGNQYELGNQFLEISKEDRALITDYVNRISGGST
jgi:c-di-GMP-binding flagellar brake protein YcgR